MHIQEVIQAIKGQIAAKEQEIAKLQAALSALGDTVATGAKRGPKPGKRGRKPGGGMSAAGRARVAAAQRARWAAKKGTAVAVVKTAGKRKLSAAHKRKLAEAAKKRWAERKAK